MVAPPTDAGSNTLLAPPRKRPARARSRSAELTTQRRRDIVQAAVKLFSRRGYEATRAEDIAQAAKIAKGTLYLYFRSKEAIYSAAITFAVAELQALSSERVNSAAEVADKMRAAIAVRLHFWTEHPVMYRLLLTLGREPRHRRQTNELLRSGQAQLLAILQEGVAQGQLPERDYAPLAWALLDMVRGATERRLDRLSDVSVEAEVDTIAGFARCATLNPARGSQSGSK